MASLHKDPRGKSSFWYCAYTKADGKRSYRSTKTSDKKQAWQVCNAWSKAASLGTKLTPDRARQVIAAGVADVLMASGQDMPSATIRDWCKRWLEFKEVENETRTHERYKTSVDRFIKFLGSNADKDLRSNAPRVPNPVNPAEDFADKWGNTQYRHLKLEENFKLWLEQANADFQSLANARDVDLIVEQAKEKYRVKLNRAGLREKLGIGAVHVSTAPKSHIITETPAKPWCQV